jgi:hypothetical protein
MYSRSLFAIPTRKQYSRLGKFLFRTVESLDAAAMRKLAIGLIALQLTICVLAALTRVMLQGDGAYFVYTLSVDQPWALEWQDLASRSSTYILTVVPTLWIADNFHLSPLSIASLNGFIFYLAPTILFAIGCSLIWKSHPKFLIFPIVQYATSSVMAFGFPSEIHIAPGFLWISLFLILKRQALSVWFFLSFVGLLFSHELAIPAAIIVAYLALMQARERDHEANSNRFTAIAAILIICSVAALFFIRSSAGPYGSSSNAIYVVDPRRILNNPTLWVLMAVLATISYVAQSRIWKINGVAATLVVASAFLPLLLEALFPNLNFTQGRYDSARSIIGLAMFLLALGFVLVRSSENAGEPVLPLGDAAVIPYALAAVIAAAAGSDALFLRDWTIALNGLDRVVTSGQQATSPEFISYDQAKELMLPNEARMNDRIDFYWALPFRSIVLANGQIPGRIVYGDADLHSVCDRQKRVAFKEAAVPLSVVERMQSFACTHDGPPEIVTISKRIKEELFRIWAAARNWLRSNTGTVSN